MKYIDQTFEQQDVLLDGNEFIRCTFNGCRLIFRGDGGLVIDRPTLNASQWTFQGAAGATLKCLAALHAGGLEGQTMVEKVIDFIRKGAMPDTIH